MKNGIQDGIFLSSVLDVMCQRAEISPDVPREFDIADLLTDDEWQNATTYYGHVTLGQRFCSYVENGKVKGIRKTGKKSPKGRTQYERI